MIPVHQEFIHDPENGFIGDCQRAVIASLMELPLKEVPHFLKEAWGGGNSKLTGQWMHENELYWHLMQIFLRSYGYAWLVTDSLSSAIFGRQGNVYHEISGPSPRDPNMQHAVVGRNGLPFFDPHPSGKFLTGDPDKWQFGYLIRV